jgi:hypothetical protein
MPKVSNEKKNLSRIAGEFLVASRLAQNGYMVALQWGTAIGYDILAFDQYGATAFIEVKTTASHPGAWVLQARFRNEERDEAAANGRRFVACVDLATPGPHPIIYLFPVSIVRRGLHYFYGGHFPNSRSFMLALNRRPRGRSREPSCLTVGEQMDAQVYIDRYDRLGLGRIIA